MRILYDSVSYTPLPQTGKHGVVKFMQFPNKWSKFLETPYSLACLKYLALVFCIFLGYGAESKGNEISVTSNEHCCCIIIFGRNAFGCCWGNNVSWYVHFVVTPPLPQCLHTVS